MYLLVAVGVALLCTGCAFRRHVAGMAIEHNDFVAQTTNRQTVLNILRASQREPMHFTSFSSVSGKAQGTGQLGLGTSIGGDGGSLAETDTIVTKTGPAGVLIETTTTDTVVDTLNRGVNNLTPSAQVSVTTGTDFTMGINATEEFYRGIIGQLSEGIVVHYLRQGFPRDLLSHLLIRRLEFRARIVGSDGATHEVPLGVFNNTPDEPNEVRRFADALKCLQLGFTTREAEERRVQVPALTAISGINPDVLARIRSETGKDNVVTYYLLMASARTEFDLALAPTGNPDCEVAGGFQTGVATWAAARPRTVEQQQPQNGAPAGNTKPQDAAPQDATPQDSTSQGATPRDVAIASQSGMEATEGPRAVAEDVGGRGVTTLRTAGDYFSRVLPPNYKGELVIDITLRSVEGILYYLGEYVRNPGSPRLKSGDCPPSRPYCLPIIRIRPATEVPYAERFVDVRYRGTTYAVPLAGRALTEGAGRSSQVVSLVQQLLNLHRSSRDLPGTTLVRVTN